VINLVFSSDAAGFARSATVLGSILRRTRAPVWVRYWCTGFCPPSIDRDGLRVDFIEVEDDPEGKYPGHVPPAVFNRLRVIEDCRDWDRCLVMDHDMAVFCDMAEYFREDFEGELLMGRLFGEGNTLGLQMKQRGGLPEEWQEAEEYPYFFMGPMMNLEGMRKSGTWDRLLRAHREIGHDEQLSLTAACEGRVRGLGKKWNIVPQWDDLEKLTKQLDDLGNGEAGGLEWKHEVPEGLIHWSEYAKPWHYQSQVWRADLWEAEETSWEQLRLGLWDKPVAVIVGGRDGEAVKSLLKRGWRVKCVATDFEVGDLKSHPDLDVGSLEILKESFSKPPHMMRIKVDSTSVETMADVLDQCGNLRWLTLMGEFKSLPRILNGRVIKSVKVKRFEWPCGGVDPSVMDYETGELGEVSENEDLYLELD